MNLYAPGSFNGNYKAVGDITKADCVIGHEFGYRRDGPGLVNSALAKIIAQRYFDFPLLVHPNIAKGLKGTEQESWIALEFSGESSNITGTRGESTWGELVQAKRFMDENGLEQAIHVSHAFHIGRVALQAKRLGMEAVVPEDLPKEFDPQSKQIWTRNQVLWSFHELFGVPLVLLPAGKI